MLEESFHDLWKISWAKNFWEALQRDRALHLVVSKLCKVVLMFGKQL